MNKTLRLSIGAVLLLPVLASAVPPQETTKPLDVPVSSNTNEVRAALEQALKAHGIVISAMDRKMDQLCISIHHEDVPTVKATLASGVDWTNYGKTAEHQWSVLHAAVWPTSSNGLEILKLLLAGKADVNARAEYRETPLHFAVASSNAVAVQLLLEHGAEVNAQRRDRKTPLHLAASEGSLEIVKILIENKATVEARDLYKNTPLMCAVVAKHKDIEKFLRQHGAKE